MAKTAKGKGSQLSQLRGSIRAAGLSRASKPTGRKQGKNGAVGRHDPEARAKKIEAIRAAQNLFDLKTTKPKFAVGGQSGRTVQAGKPAQSRSRANQTRREKLLPEYLARHRTGAFVDRRFGEGDDRVGEDDKALEKFTREQQDRFLRSAGRAGKRGIFNLGDEGDLEDDGFDGFTHGGRMLSLSDDEDAAGAGPSKPRNPQNDLGGFELKRRSRSPSLSGDEQQSDRKKSKAEVMSELISKSKAYKHERQQVKDADEDARIALDEELKEIRGLLDGFGPTRGPPNAGKGKARMTEGTDATSEGTNRAEGEPISSEEASGDDETDGEGIPGEEPTPGVDRALLAQLLGSSKEDGDSKSDDGADAYDRHVRELALSARAKPSDRLKTAEERALEEAERLQKLEAARLRRMRGEAGDSDGEEGAAPRKGKAKRREADDLDDDYMAGSEEDVPWEVGEGLTEAGLHEDIERDGVEGEESEPDEGSAGEEEDLDAEDFEAEGPESDAELPVGPIEFLAPPSADIPSKPSRKASSKAQPELAYTYPCPASHSELLELLESTNASPSDVPTVLSRIRTLHHPSLSPSNREKLASLTGVVLDHIVHLSATRPSGAWPVIDAIVRQHLIGLVRAYPVEAAERFVEKLGLMQRNLVRGLATQSRDPEGAKTWPGVVELMLLRLVGVLWSASDFSHPVAAPALLLIGHFLGQCKVRDLSDVASGIFLSTLVLQYEHLSKRLVPEAINFVFNAIAVLSPAATPEQGYPGSAPLQAILRRPSAKAALEVDGACAGLAPGPLKLCDLVAGFGAPQGPEASAQAKVDLLGAAYSLAEGFAELYAGLDAAVEVLGPVERVVSGTPAGVLPGPLELRRSRLASSLTRSLASAAASRRPLSLQRHRAIPIPSFAPAFDDGDPTKRRWDPDSDRAEARKLRALIKKEKKGAARELRKDARFLRAEKDKEKALEDEAYNAKIARITAGLQIERAEEKKEQRIKERIKKLDKKRSGGKR